MEQIPLTLRIDEDLHEKVRKISFDERRSINNLINYIIRKYIEEQERNKEGS